MPWCAGPQITVYTELAQLPPQLVLVVSTQVEVQAVEGPSDVAALRSLP